MSDVRIIGLSSPPATFLLEQKLLEAELRRRLTLIRRDRPQEAQLLALLANTSSFSLRDWPAARHVTAALFEQKLGAVVCPHCSATYDAAVIKFERFSVNVGPMAGGGGRKILCPLGHELLEVVDWRA